VKIDPLSSSFITIHVFIKLHEDAQQIETSRGERDNKVNTAISLILLALYPTVVQTDLETLNIYNDKFWTLKILKSRSLWK
jgi:hypothetical protein